MSPLQFNYDDERILQQYCLLYISERQGRMAIVKDVFNFKKYRREIFLQKKSTFCDFKKAEKLENKSLVTTKRVRISGEQSEWFKNIKLPK